jgi:hypothetical protein
MWAERVVGAKLDEVRNVKRTLLTAGEGGAQAWNDLRGKTLDWLREQARRHFNIAEIGAWKGRCTEALASSTGGHVTVVDAWAGTTDLSDEIAHLDAEAAFGEYLANVGEFRNVTTYRALSSEAWRRLHHESFDMVWIDACQTLRVAPSAMVTVASIHLDCALYSPTFIVIAMI